MNRLVRRVAARPVIAVTNVVLRCSVFVTVSESGCGATRSSERSDVGSRHRRDRRPGVPLLLIIAVRLRLPEKAVSDARAELVTHDLIAWQRPLTQVLSLQQPVLHRRGSLQSLGDLFRSAGNASGNSAEKNSAGSES